MLLEAVFFHSSQKKLQISIHGFVSSLVTVSFAAVCIVNKNEISSLSLLLSSGVCLLMNLFEKC